MIKSSILLADKEDAELLSELTVKSKSFWGYSQKQLEGWHDDLTLTEEYIEDHEVFKLELGNQIIGYYSYKLEQNTALLDNMFLNPDNIGRGYGKSMMDHFINNIKLHNSRKALIYSDPNVESFYSKFGFKTIGKLPSSIKGRFLPIMERTFKIK
ncbi:MAG: GNAT family N-acetyltransferase [Flavobacteriales bacterium]